MNIHPILVHFPVALLTLYCVLELIRFNIVINRPYWFYIKAVLVCVGGLGLLAAYYSGTWARQIVLNVDPSLRPLISRHEMFAKLDIALFGIIAACYVIAWAQRENFSSLLGADESLQKFWSFLVKVAHFFVETRFAVVMAIVGLICITLTGALGGSIIYGQHNDPFTGWVYHLFFRQ